MISPPRRGPAVYMALVVASILFASGCISAQRPSSDARDADDRPGVTQRFANGTSDLQVNDTEGAILGLVLNENGAPVAGAGIVVIGIEGTLSTGSDGRFGVEHVAPRTYVLRVDHREYRSVETEVVVQAGMVREVEIVLVAASTGDAGFTEHFHDLWGDATSLTVFDGDLNWAGVVQGSGAGTHTWACAETSPGAGATNTLGLLGNSNDCHRLRIFLPLGKTILPGTSTIVAKVDWKSSSTLAKVKLQYVAANSTTGNSIELSPGTEGEIPVAYPMNDHGHARQTAWSFILDARPALGPAGFSQASYNENQIGAFHVVLAIKKGAFIPPEPAHRRFWADGPEFPLLKDHKVLLNLGAPYTRDPTQCYLPCVTFPINSTVPPGTTRLKVEMAYGTTQPAIDSYLPKKSLAFRTSAMQPATTTLDSLKVIAPASNTGGKVTYEMKLDATEVDAFYQLRTGWGLYIAKEGEERAREYYNECNIYFAGYGCGSNYFTFNVVAVNDDWTPELAA